MTTQDILIDQLVKTIIRMYQSPNPKYCHIASKICNMFLPSHTPQFDIKIDAVQQPISIVYKLDIVSSYSSRRNPLSYKSKNRKNVYYNPTLHMLIYQSGMSNYELENLLWELM